jgi:hypothetical protein
MKKSELKQIIREEIINQIQTAQSQRDMQEGLFGLFNKKRERGYYKTEEEFKNSFKGENGVSFSTRSGLPDSSSGAILYAYDKKGREIGKFNPKFRAGALGYQNDGSDAYKNLGD